MGHALLLAMIRNMYESMACCMYVRMQLAKSLMYIDTLASWLAGYIAIAIDCYFYYYEYCAEIRGDYNSA